ncbi:MAG TPA: hypothetical protein VF725_07575 [Ktedonobacterales bacterium]
MATSNYASILGAVGKMLDLAEARSFAVREGEQSLILDLVDGRDERHSYELSVADVAELIAWSQRAEESAPRATAFATRDEGVLRAFLERHTITRELVGAR